MDQEFTRQRESNSPSETHRIQCWCPHPGLCVNYGDSLRIRWGSNFKNRCFLFLSELVWQWCKLRLWNRFGGGFSRYNINNNHGLIELLSGSDHNSQHQASVKCEIVPLDSKVLKTEHLQRGVLPSVHVNFFLMVLSISIFCLSTTARSGILPDLMSNAKCFNHKSIFHFQCPKKCLIHQGEICTTSYAKRKVTINRLQLTIDCKYVLVEFITWLYLIFNTMKLVPKVSFFHE